MTSLVVGPARLLLEHHCAGARVTARARVTLHKRLGTREPDDISAYHREVVHRWTFLGSYAGLYRGSWDVQTMRLRRTRTRVVGEGF